VNIKDEDAYETSRLLARAEGLFVGMSSGAAAYVALQLAKDLPRGVLVVILPDGGERYLSTTLFRSSTPVAHREPKLELYDTLSALSARLSRLFPARYPCIPAALP
jgi:cysteinyl-tRNA synthetase